jgi:RHS repeat-associated protein
LQGEGGSDSFCGVGYYATESCLMESDPRPKTRVGGSRTPLAGRARRFPSQALEPRQETVTTSSTSASGVVEWLSNDPIGISGGLNQYVFCANNPVNMTDPLGLWGVQFGGLKIGSGDMWLIFDQDAAMAYSRGGQGVINAFTGGLFWEEYGLFYNKFNQQWKDLGYESNECNKDFKTGMTGGRVAEGALLAAGAVWGIQAIGPAAGSSLNLPALEQTGFLAQQIMAGKGAQAAAIVAAMAQTPAGRQALQQIHIYASRLIQIASSPQAANALRTVQDITGGLPR